MADKNIVVQGPEPHSRRDEACILIQVIQEIGVLYVLNYRNRKVE